MISHQDNKIYGYASVFNVVDSCNDVILPGAFYEEIESFHEGKKILLLWQHKADEPIGIVDNISEDSYGLYIEARIATKSGKAADAYELIKSGVINGLSIGYKPRDFEYSSENCRYIKNLQLFEISLVTYPANDAALITNFKNFQY